MGGVVGGDREGGVGSGVGRDDCYIDVVGGAGGMVGGIGCRGSGAAALGAMVAVGQV